MKKQKLPLALAAVVLALVLGQNVIGSALQPFTSVEVRIAEHSPNGLGGGAVVPASCPSYSHEGTGLCPACGPNQIFSQTSGPNCIDSQGFAYFCPTDTCADCPAGYTSNGDHTACVPACAANYGQSCSASNSCGTNTGTYSCSGTCSATAPTCTPPTIDICSGAGCTPSGPSVTTLPGPVTISWSCPSPNTSSAGSSNSQSSPFSTGGTTSGSATVTVTNTTTFTVQCNPTTAQMTATATVLNPNLSLAASPSRVQSGNSSTLTWSASSVQSCTLSGPNVSASATADVNGTVSTHNTSTGAVTGRSVYTLTCQSSVGSFSTSVTVTLIPNVIEI